MRNLIKLSDESGRFKMMAIDQRGSLAKILAKYAGGDPDNLPYEAMARTKEAITELLSPFATAVLTDPIYGYPYSVRHIPAECALLLCTEATGYDKAGPGGKERKSKMLEGWSVEKASRAGADAIKFLAHYSTEASNDARSHQHQVIRALGAECAKYDLPFLLEVVTYPIHEASVDTPEFARKKPGLVAECAREFSKPEYKVDVLKLEFPADLKYCYEYSRRVFDSKEREPIYDLEEVRGFCQTLDEASRLPWVILSAGVAIEEFIKDVELATEAGASGFLCGRAIWQEALTAYPDIETMKEYLESDAAYNFTRCNAACDLAVPWFDHSPFEGWDSVELAGQEPDWFMKY